MAIPRSPKPPRGFGAAEQLAERRGREVEKLRAEIAELRERIAELESEREADTRAMAAFQAASGQGIGEVAAAAWALVERFADRIAAQAADAPQDGLSATQTDGDGVQAADIELEFGRPTAGLSEPEPCDGDCDCDYQPGQPCLCPERDCYCGPCRVCGDNPQQPKRDTACTHGPGFQCVSCVGEDAFSFDPLGPARLNDADTTEDERHG